MRTALLCALIFGGVGFAHAQDAGRKEQVRKLLQIQKPGIEAMARGVVERPAAQLIQAAGQAIQAQVPPEKREALGKAIEADVKKFVEESAPLLGERAVKLAPATLGAALEQKFTEDELKQLIAWFESPLNRKYQQFLPEVQNAMLQQLLTEAGTLLEPRLKALQERTRNALLAAMAPPSGAAGASAPASRPAPPAAAPPAKPASK